MESADLWNVVRGNVPEVLFGKVHFAQMMPVGPLTYERGVTKRALDCRISAGVRGLIDGPGERENRAWVRHRAAGCVTCNVGFFDLSL